MKTKQFGVSARFGLLGLCFVGMTTVMTATQMCSSIASGTNVTSIGSCMVGNLTFSNFADSIATGGGNPGAGEIDFLSVGGSANDVVLNFNPNLGTGTSGQTITDLHLTFTVSGGLTGADLDMTQNNGGAINEIACLGGLGCSSGPNMLWNVVATSGQTGMCVGSSETGLASGTCTWGNSSESPVYFFKDISITNANTSHDTQFAESFSTVVPEPMTLGLMGVGLLALAGLRRRVKK